MGSTNSLKVLSYLKKSPLSADVLSSAPPEILPFPPLTEEISPVLSAKPAMIFSERDGRQSNTDITQGPPILASRTITRFKAKEVPRGEIESIVHKEVCYTTKELNEFKFIQAQVWGIVCGNRL